MKNFIQIAVIILLSAVLLHQCSLTAQLKSTTELNTAAALDSVKYYKNKLGQVVAEKQTYKGTATQLKQLFEAEQQKSNQFKAASKKWRKLYSAAKIELQFKLDSIDVPFTVPVPYNFTRDFLKETKDYTIKGIANQNGLNIDFRAKATITPFTGIKPTGLFAREHRTEITSSNDNIQITDFENFNFVEKPKRWGVGLSFGFGFYHKTIFTGVTVNRNFIVF
ncbi:hypothetical protein [Tenacibaculum soleae]|uniref:hypothetical protein n=1 Tax=Tenacibaculum soleae TaxID=447689 RepID=UPI002300C8C5|nr:hypothetical protein [Tenacibaculum soleae]